MHRMVIFKLLEHVFDKLLWELCTHVRRPRQIQFTSLIICGAFGGLERVAACF